MTVQVALNVYKVTETREVGISEIDFEIIIHIENSKWIIVIYEEIYFHLKLLYFRRLKI